MGLASNRDYPRLALKALGIEQLFSAVVGVLDVARSKPAPDMIIKTLTLMKAPPEETLYVCDSKGDLLAAAASAVKAFSVSTGGHSAEELLKQGAFRAGDALNEILELF
jgi:phosphoglycolate phosphatase-like HAD superfamily hydrolase